MQLDNVIQDYRGNKISLKTVILFKIFFNCAFLFFLFSVKIIRDITSIIHVLTSCMNDIRSESIRRNNFLRYEFKIGFAF